MEHSTTYLTDSFDTDKKPYDSWFSHGYLDKGGYSVLSNNSERYIKDSATNLVEYRYVNIDEVKFQFKAKLNNIASQIDEAKEILSYPRNWDDEDAEATNVNTFLNAASFLHSYSSFIERNYGIVIQPPYMDIMKDGSIYLNWEVNDAKFLIIFKKDNTPFAYFYGERKSKCSNTIPFKSAIEINGDVDEIVAQWMKNSLV